MLQFSSCLSVYLGQFLLPGFLSLTCFRDGWVIQSIVEHKGWRHGSGTSHRAASDQAKEPGAAGLWKSTGVSPSSLHKTASCLPPAQPSSPRNQLSAGRTQGRALPLDHTAER